VNTTQNVASGWFSDRRNSTGAVTVASAGTNIGVAGLMVSSMGTAVVVQDVGYSPALNATGIAERGFLPVVTGEPASSVSQELEHIRQFLPFSVSDLATLFGVSRQTIYNWVNGEQPKPEHLLKLHDLSSAGDVVAAAGLRIDMAQMKRKLIHGKSLLQTAREGGSIQAAVSVLVEIRKVETEQRARLTERFKNRQPGVRSVEAEFPAENDPR
jgi:transcriptional regulator with XRE-family HTH domain